MGVRTMSEKKPAAKSNGHGGKRAGSGKPMGARNLRSYGKLTEINAELAGIVPVKFEGDSLDFLRATMTGKIWPSREQIYAARAMLPIEHPAPPYANGLTVAEIEQAAIERYLAEQNPDDHENTEWLARQLDRLDDAQTHAGEGHISEIIVPEPARPAFRKVEPVTIDAVAEDISALDDGISMGYEAEAASTHTQPHTSNTEKPAQRSLWDDPAAAFGAPDGPFNPPVERVQVTRGANGRLVYLVDGKRRE